MAVNDITDAKRLGHLLKYGSILGNLEEDVAVEGDSIKVAGRTLKVPPRARRPPAQAIQRRRS